MNLGIADSLNEKISRYKTEWRLHVANYNLQLHFQEEPLIIIQGRREVLSLIHI